ncbi:MAG TPA: YbbR-like domain-containing protein [Bacteroidia bacterium]|nr:YbbR-like domain-containing protein [Bacteroidia bacterium]
MQRETPDKPEKKTFFNRRGSSFLVCVAIAGLFWLLQALSKEYTQLIRVPVSYSHLPQQALVPVELPDSVDVQVAASGFTFFAYRLSKAVRPVNLDFRNSRSLGSGDFALSTSLGITRLEGPVGNGLRVLRVLPDTIVLSFAGRSAKKVPVRAKVSVTTAPMYRLADSIRAEPPFVIVSGAEALVKRIEFVETEEKRFTDIDKTVTENARLVLPADLQQVDIKPAKVKLVIPVGKYTEGRLTVPVEAVNVPSTAQLKTFPDKVEVVFLVPVELYKEIRPEMFRVVVDYASASPQNNTLPVQIVRQPLNVRNIHSDPPRVEYIIRK